MYGRLKDMMTSGEVLGKKELMQEDGGSGHERVNAGRWRCWA